MSIIVVCPGCHKSFKVSDRFAGKAGACPSCKGQITVPDKKDEVKVHAPDEFADGGRSTTGQLVTKPVARKDAKWNPVVAAGIGGGVLLVFLLSWITRPMIADSVPLQVICLIIMSPPLVVAAYWFLRDDELAPYRGNALYIRTGVCAAAYACLWGVYAYVSLIGLMDAATFVQLLIVAAPIVVVGALAALACLDLDFGSGVFHYGFYVLVTMLLGTVAGIQWLPE